MDAVKMTAVVDLVLLLIEVDHCVILQQEGIFIRYPLVVIYVEYSGLEPLTSTLPVLRSSQMS